MEKTSHPLGFVFEDGKVSGKLKAGITLEQTTHDTFVMREATVSDILDAEMEADVSKPLNFAAALMARQLVSLGDYTGKVTVNMLRRLKPADWRILRAAQAELDGLGEDASAPSETS